MNYGLCLSYLGRPTEALSVFEMAEPILQQHGTTMELARCQANRATCLGDLYRSEEALRLHGQALAALRRSAQPIEFTEYQMNYAACLQSLGRAAEALALYEMAEVVLDGQDLMIQLARCRLNHATCLGGLNKPEDALSLYEAAEPILRDNGAPLDHATCQLNRANCLLVLKRSAQAAPLYAEVIRSCEEMGAAAWHIQWRAHYNLARLLLVERNDVAGAIEQVNRALAHVDALVGTAVRLEDRVGLRETYANVYQFAVRLELRRGDRRAAYHYAQQAKGRALADLLEQRLQVGTDEDDELERMFAHIVADEWQIMARIRHNAMPNDEDITRLHTLRDERIGLVSDLARRRPERGLLAFGTVRNLADIQRVLQPGEAILDFLDMQSQVIAFLVTGEKVGELAFVSALPGVGIDQAVMRWRDVVRLAADGQPCDVQTHKVLQQLFELLIAPFHPHLQRIVRLFISPSGRLHEVPFAALGDEQKEK